MKKTLLKFSKSLLSTEETKTIKGGYDPPPGGGGGGGTGGFYYVICSNGNWLGVAGYCPTVEQATVMCQYNQYPSSSYVSKTC